MEIADRRIATIHFTLTDGGGNVVGSTRGHDPLVHMQGTGGIVPALEQALNGKKAGDRFEVQVTPETGYGPRHEGLVQKVPRSALSSGQEPQVGAVLRAKTDKMGDMDVLVTAVHEDSISVDGNHPLAGRNLTLDVEVVDVRVATPEEIQFGVS